MIIKIDVEHGYGDIVYVSTDTYQDKCQIIGYKLGPGDIVMYGVETSNGLVNYFYDFQLSVSEDMEYRQMKENHE